MPATGVKAPVELFSNNSTGVFAAETRAPPAPILVQTAGGVNIPTSLGATIFPPTGGGPVPGVIVPPLMQAPMLVACPTPICNVAAISNSATASLLFITPMGNL